MSHAWSKLLTMSTRFAQLDNDLLAVVQHDLARATRADRREIITHGAVVWALLDQWSRKSPRQRRAPGGDRLHEWVTTWREIGHKTHWKRSTTALRERLDRAVPHLLPLPVWDGTGYTGVRLLRLDHANHGILRDIAGSKVDRHSSWRVARAVTVLLTIIKCLDPAEPSFRRQDIGRHVDELYDLWEHRTATLPPDPDDPWDGEAEPEVCMWTVDFASQVVRDAYALARRLRRDPST